MAPSSPTNGTELIPDASPDDPRQDATAERKRQQLEHVLAHTTEGIIIINHEGTVAYANAAAGRFFGRAPEQLIGEMIGRPSAEAAAQELQLYTPEEVRTVEMDSRPIEWEDEQGWLVNLHDVTDRKRSETELRQAAIFFEEAHEGVMITDAQKRIVTVNRAFTQITGYSADEAQGRTPRLLSSGLHDHAFYRAMWHAIRTRGQWSGEIWNRRRDGVTYPQLLTIREIRDRAGYLTHYIGVFSDLSRLKAYQNQLEQLAHTDPLTGLPNRLLFQDRVGQALRSVDSESPTVAVFIIDLNDFKSINDSLGHAAGDEVLARVADRLGSIEVPGWGMPEAYTVARLGGDEFGVLIPDLADPRDAGDLAAHFARAIEVPVPVGDHNIPLSAHMGMSVYPDQATTEAELMQQADSAMYQAKREGLGQRFFSEELTEQARERLELGTELRRALERDELQLHYQLQIDLLSGRWIGIEALARWPHPERGWISPGQFIPLAERVGLIGTLGHWVLEQACRQAQAWREQGLEVGRMSVNVSAPQLARGDLPEQVDAILARTGLPPEGLALEITESVLMEQEQYVAEQLQALRARGIAIALDDFGTGYSSLSYLKEFPVDELKIDRSFVDGLPHDEQVLKINRAIIALGESLRFTVIAEGIETPSQQQLLIREGCNRAQGFLYARPLAAEEAEHALRAGTPFGA